MLGTREYTLCSPFRANAHNSSLYNVMKFLVTKVPGSDNVLTLHGRGFIEITVDCQASNWPLSVDSQPRTAWAS